MDRGQSLGEHQQDTHEEGLEEWQPFFSYLRGRQLLSTEAADRAQCTAPDQKSNDKGEGLYALNGVKERSKKLYLSYIKE